MILPRLHHLNGVRPGVKGWESGISLKVNHCALEMTDRQCAASSSGDNSLVFEALLLT
ncbi:uncharacterized protein PHALS_00061 [Plasmopara halstedii]|uniref:Uncharacterized protein n=1 Tax=Plasmopara halstedii TaxID=4781 RepID=A0A0P1A5A3_PLAHL|nr:uncharacterized protein PHALS_00061 [Plasmopara halstedii]CEG35725.1 hypothetical protein PHALS_00061 [Plasmopara halstedii]|eukprot:XP_024572094.1 hypothetical protein PHALS_00061 [Plasmopara halstedii]